MPNKPVTFGVFRTTGLAQLADFLVGGRSTQLRALILEQLAQTVLEKIRTTLESQVPPAPRVRTGTLLRSIDYKIDRRSASIRYTGAYYAPILRSRGYDFYRQAVGSATYMAVNDIIFNLARTQARLLGFFAPRGGGGLIGQFLGLLGLSGGRSGGFESSITRALGLRAGRDPFTRFERRIVGSFG